MAAVCESLVHAGSRSWIPMPHTAQVVFVPSITALTLPLTAQVPSRARTSRHHAEWTSGGITAVRSALLTLQWATMQTASVPVLAVTTVFVATCAAIRRGKRFSRRQLRPHSQTRQVLAGVPRSVFSQRVGLHTALGDDDVITKITVLPLGHEGHSRQELFEVAAVAVQGFFVDAYDASEKNPPGENDLARLRCQVYDDLALRYAPGPGRRGLLLVARTTLGVVIGCIGIEAMYLSEVPVSPDAKKELCREVHRPITYMSNLAVLKEFRGRGLGQRLIVEAERQAKTLMRSKEVVLLVNAQNCPARQLYEKLGYCSVFEDRWATRAVPGYGGAVQKVRVLNVGYSRQLVQSPSLWRNASPVSETTAMDNSEPSLLEPWPLLVSAFNAVAVAFSRGS